MIDLIVCSICLRVRRGSEWLDAECVVREISSYDRELPRFHGAVWDAVSPAGAKIVRPTAPSQGGGGAYGP